MYVQANHTAQAAGLGTSRMVHFYSCQQALCDSASYMQAVSSPQALKALPYIQTYVYPSLLPLGDIFLTPDTFTDALEKYKVACAEC